MAIKRILKKIYKVFVKEPTVVKLKPHGKPTGRVLLSYLIEPFLYNRSEALMRSHTNFWECEQIAKIYLRRGYAVDVISWNNKTFVPRKRYDFLIDIYYNLARLSAVINKDCRKFLHITGAHWEFRNKAATARLKALEERRGTSLAAHRITIPPNRSLPLAERATIMGNDFTMGTYKDCGIELHRIFSSSTVDEHFTCRRNFEEARRNFIWLGGSGLVLKGLDLVLEAFSQIPGLHLSVCAPLKGEEDFVRVYHRELYETPNIKMHGWVDLGSDYCRKLVEGALALVYPSCSEAGAGSVVNCMHMGLIPVVSYQSGVDIEDFGFILKESSIDEIREVVQQISQMSSEELEERSRATVAFARKRYTKKAFIESYENFVNSITAGNGPEEQPMIPDRLE